MTPPAAAPAARPGRRAGAEFHTRQTLCPDRHSSVESNACSTADTLRNAGMVPSVKEGKLSGKAFWRVVVGPRGHRR
ncbi:MAG: hypothetical protein R3D59_15490 [Paracoccaceae bacterium]